MHFEFPSEFWLYIFTVFANAYSEQNRIVGTKRVKWLHKRIIIYSHTWHFSVVLESMSVGLSVNQFKHYTWNGHFIATITYWLIKIDFDSYPGLLCCVVIPSHVQWHYEPSMQRTEPICFHRRLIQQPPKNPISINPLILCRCLVNEIVPALVLFWTFLYTILTKLLFLFHSMCQDLNSNFIWEIREIWKNISYNRRLHKKHMLCTFILWIT